MIILHPVAARVKKPVAAYRSGFFCSKTPSHRTSQANGRLLYRNLGDYLPLSRPKGEHSISIPVMTHTGSGRNLSIVTRKP